MGQRKFIPSLILSILFVTGGLFAQSIEVTPDQDLNAAIDFVNQGNATELVLTSDSQSYTLNPVEITSAITIKAAEGLAGMPTIILKGGGVSATNFIDIMADIKLQGLMIDGYDPVTATYDSVKYLLKMDDVDNAPDVIVEDCHIKNIYRDANPEFSMDGNIFDVGKGGHAGVVRFERTTLENTGDEAIRAINTHKDPVHPTGQAYESLTVRNCTFVNINGSAVKLESDASLETPDAKVIIENCTFFSCQRRVIWVRDHKDTQISKLIIANTKIGNDTFSGTGTLISFQREGSVVAYVDTFAVSGVKANGDTVVLDLGGFNAETPASRTGAETQGTVVTQTIYGFDPLFVDADNGDFTLAAGSMAYLAGPNGGPIGDTRWATNPPAPAEETVIPVTPDQDLNGAIDFVNQGNANVIELDDSAPYTLNPVEILAPITIRAAAGLSGRPTIILKGGGVAATNFIDIAANITLQGLMIDGYDPVTASYDSVKYLLKMDDTENAPNVIVEDCHIKNIYRDANPEFSMDGNIFDVGKGGHAGVVRFERTTLENTGDEAIRAINTHKDPVHPTGRAYESLTVRNCTFININGSSIKLESDASLETFDAPVLIENCTFYMCQRRVIWTRDHANSIYRNLIITDTKIGNDTFSGTGTLISFQREGSFVAHVDTFAVSGVKANGDTVVLDLGGFNAETPASRTGAETQGTVDLTSIYGIDPGFADPANGDFTLAAGSALLTLGHDGLALGDRRWAPNGIPTAIEEAEEVPSDYKLSQNYPNPFNPSTKIEFTVPASGIFSLKIYNILGQEVANLLNKEISAGHHTVNFNASKLSSGVYIYSLQGENVVLTKKMLLLK